MGLGAGGATAGMMGPWGLAALIGSSLAGPVLSSMFAPEGQELKSFSGTGVDPTQMLSGVNDMLSTLGRSLADRASTPVSVPSAYVQQPGAYTGGTLPFPIGVVGSDPALGNPSLLNLPGMGEFESLSKLFAHMGGGIGSGGSVTGADATSPFQNDGGGIDAYDAFDANMGASIDPDGPLGGDAEMGDQAFDNFFQPAFSQPTRANGAEEGAPSEARSAFGDVGPQRKPLGGALVRGADLEPQIGDTEPQLAGAGGDDLDQGLGAVMMLLESLKGQQGARAGAMA